MSDFSRFVDGRMVELGLIQEHLAEKLGVAPAYVHLIRTGNKKPPVSTINDWAKALDLHGAARERFLDLAALERTPERIRKLIRRLSADRK